MDATAQRKNLAPRYTAKSHPEARADEVFIGEYSEEVGALRQYSEVAWKSKRKGNISQKNIFPVFVDQSEIEDNGFVVVIE